MYVLKANEGKGVSALFPRYPLETKPISDRSVNVVREADYIAETQAKRTFPWRYVVVAREDSDLVEIRLLVVWQHRLQWKIPLDSSGTGYLGVVASHFSLSRRFCSGQKSGNI